MTRVLVADDEVRIRQVVEFALRAEGFEVVCAGGGAEALEIVAEGDVDLVVLDVRMPDLGGLEVCRRVRARGATPIIFLSSKTEETDRVVGLELGGDDYVTKPFSPRELLARVRSVLRRAGGAAAAPSGPLRCGDLEVDIGRHLAAVAGEPVAFTATELRVLHAVLAAGGRVLSRAQLIERAYPGNHHVAARTIDTHVRRIRGKLARFAIDPFATVTGVGYRAAM